MWRTCRVLSVRWRPGLAGGSGGPNSFPGRVDSAEIPWPPAAFCAASRAKCHFSGQNRLPARETSDLAVQSAAFSRSVCDPGWAPLRATAKTTTLSRIPAWTPPDAERQCCFFFAVLGLRAVGLSFVASAGICVVFWGSFFEIPNTIEKLKPRIAESTYFVGGLAVPSPDFATLSGK